MMVHLPFKVELYSIHGSFLKLEYLKTEFNEDNGTYAIVKVTFHSCRIMVNLSISDYFEVNAAPLKNISRCVSFFCKMQNVKTYPLLKKLKVYHMIIHVFGKVQGPTLTGNLHDEYFKKHF